MQLILLAHVYRMRNRYYVLYIVFFFFKQKTAYEMRISDWSSDVCSSDLFRAQPAAAVRERDDLQQMTIRVVEIHATAIIPAIDLARSLAERIGPEGKSPLLDAAENVIELGFAYQKGEMPGRDGLVRLDEVERSEEHTSELQSLMRNSYAVFCL